MHFLHSSLKGTALVALTVLTALACGGGGGSSGTTDGNDYWPSFWDAEGEPLTYTTPVYHSEEDGHPGACLQSGCHDSEGFSPKMAWGGVVFSKDGKKREGHVQVGVVSGTYHSFVYSRSDGLYWSEATPTAINWDAADIRIRNGYGEKPKKAEDDRNGDCDSCHREDSGLAKILTAN